MKLKFILIMFGLFSFAKGFSQNEDQKWVIGVGLNAIDFYPTSEPFLITGNNSGLGSQIFNLRDHWNQFGFPKLHVTRHIWKRFALDAAFTMNQITKIGDYKIPKISYHAIDGSVQFSILKDNSKYYPYVFAGGGYTWIDKKGAGTFNGGIGLTYWFSKKFGVNGHGMYKYSPPEYPNVLQHFNYSISLVYRLSTARSRSRMKCPL